MSKAEMIISINATPKTTKKIISLDIYTPFLWNDWKLPMTSQGQNLGSTEFKHYVVSDFG